MPQDPPRASAAAATPRSSGGSDARPDAAAARIARLEDRIAELEIKSAWAEDLLDQLNATVYRQQETLELLMRELLRLRDQQAAGAGESSTRSLRDELPPHY